MAKPWLTPITSSLGPAGNQVGTYSLAQDGAVTFTPIRLCQPAVPARVQATDVNRTTAEATYSPVVNASVTSEGHMKGQSKASYQTSRAKVDPKVPAYLEVGSLT